MRYKSTVDIDLDYIKRINCKSRCCVCVFDCAGARRWT